MTPSAWVVLGLRLPNCGSEIAGGLQSLNFWNRHGSRWQSDKHALRSAFVDGKARCGCSQLTGANNDIYS